MTAIRVDVTASDIDLDVDVKVAWADPVVLALERLTDQQVSIDGDGEQGNIATIGTRGAWTLVVELPTAANDWLNARWDGAGAGEPFAFELLVPTWLVALVNGALDDQLVAEGS